MSGVSSVHRPWTLMRPWHSDSYSMNPTPHSSLNHTTNQSSTLTTNSIHTKHHHNTDVNVNTNTTQTQWRYHSPSPLIINRIIAGGSGSSASPLLFHSMMGTTENDESIAICHLIDSMMQIEDERAAADGHARSANTNFAHLKSFASANQDSTGVSSCCSSLTPSTSPPQLTPLTISSPPSTATPHTTFGELSQCESVSEASSGLDSRPTVNSNLTSLISNSTFDGSTLHDQALACKQHASDSSSSSPLPLPPLFPSSSFLLKPVDQSGGPQQTLSPFYRPSKARRLSLPANYMRRSSPVSTIHGVLNESCARRACNGSDESINTPPFLPLPLPYSLPTSLTLPSAHNGPMSPVTSSPIDGESVNATHSLLGVRMRSRTIRSDAASSSPTSTDHSSPLLLPPPPPMSSPVPQLVSRLQLRFHAKRKRAGAEDESTSSPSSSPYHTAHDSNSALTLSPLPNIASVANVPVSSHRRIFRHRPRQSSPTNMTVDSQENSNNDCRLQVDAITHTRLDNTSLD